MVVKRGVWRERGEPRHLRITSGQSACPRDPAHCRAVVWQLQEKETWWGWGGRGGRRRWRLWVSETDNHWSLTNVYLLILCGSAWFTPQTWHFTSTLSPVLTSRRHRNAHLVLIISANSTNGNLLWLIYGRYCWILVFFLSLPGAKYQSLIRVGKMGMLYPLSRFYCHSHTQKSCGENMFVQLSWLEGVRIFDIKTVTRISHSLTFIY